jgi:Protein of unknown function (DUF3617)
MTRHIVLAVAAVFSAHAAAQDLPKMKAGLWESTSSSSGAKGAQAHTTKSSMCINETVQKDMMAFSQTMGAKCSKNSMRRDGNKYYGEAECAMGNMTVKSQSVTTFTGDAAFRTENRATFSPPMAGMSESTTTQESKFTGPCPANMKPGDMNMGGRITNINDLAKMMKGMPK